jgi:hypothetical protein
VGRRRADRRLPDRDLGDDHQAGLSRAIVAADIARELLDRLWADRIMRAIVLTT